MRLTRGTVALVCVLAGWTTSHPLVQSAAGQATATQAPGAPSQPALTPTEIEDFLLRARVVSRRTVNIGITNSVRATMSDGRLTHDAHIQNVDIYKAVFQTPTGTETNFRDSFLFNIAAYRLARLLGLSQVPVSVERSIDRTNSAVTWWVDDVMMDENTRFKKDNDLGPDPDRTARQLHLSRVFDELIQNKDRNGQNLLWTTDWSMWLIDHTRAFRRLKQLLKPASLDRCDRVLLERMRELTVASVTKAVGKTLGKSEIEAVLARRDLLVKHFEAKIAEHGEASVLYTYLPR